jgi:hypothetical protein
VLVAAADVDRVAEQARAAAGGVHAGRPRPGQLGVAVRLPVSIGRTVAEAAARWNAEPAFANLGPPTLAGVFGSLEQCHERVIALAHAGVTDLRCVLPDAPDVHDVIAQATAMTVGTVAKLSPGAPRSAPPPPPEGWGGRSRFPRQAADVRLFLRRGVVARATVPTEGVVWLARFTTRFGSLNDYEKGRVEVIDDEPHHYAFSNVFETASRSRPYEKVAVGKNRQYVLEAIRAEGTSDWRTCAHDEFALVMDGEVRIELAKVTTVRPPIPDSEGSVALDGGPGGRAWARSPPAAAT